MNKFKLKKLFIYILLILLLLICIIPFYIMIINGTRSSSEINSGVSLFPGKYLLQNYQNLTSKLNIGRGLLNSAIVAISATLLSSYISALTAYGFAFYINAYMLGMGMGAPIVYTTGGGCDGMEPEYHHYRTTWQFILIGM